MKVLKYIFSILILALAIQNSSAQRWKMKRYEINLGAGTSHYFGDIGGTADESNLFGLKDIRLRETKPSFYFGARYKLYEDIAIKFNLINGYLTSTDAGSKNAERNLNFTSSIWEYSLQAEYYFMPEDNTTKASLYGRKGQGNNFFSLSSYVFIGVGGTKYNPVLGGNVADQFPNEIGGPGFTLVIPAGLGAKYSLGPKISIGAELGGRLSLSDYIDGFNSDYSHMSDIYYFMNIVGIYKLKNDRNGVPLILKFRSGGFGSSGAGGINKSKPKRYKKPKANRPPKNKVAKIKLSKTKKYKR